MRNFATESGKSKGQFYTPSEVSQVIAKVIGISPENAVASTTAYDHLWIWFAAAEGSCRKWDAYHSGGAGERRNYCWFGADEYDFA
jgi:hypothetical protein